MRRRLPSRDDFVQGVLRGDRAMLGRAVTLVESRRPAHQSLAQEVLAALLPHSDKVQARRIGITGVPGVGKSTLIESLGLWLTGKGHRVAVLAVDPSSTRTGGSILGDKTRMELLSRDPNAFIRPSPTSGELGGVARCTRETILLCEAARYDVILVETVGVGQSEVTVAQMTDVFLVLMLAGAGDELQGIKRGLMEVADLLAVNKADGEGALPARQAAQTLRTALRYLHHGGDAQAWTPRVMTCSGLAEQGLPELWEALEAHREHMQSTGAWADKRLEQQRRWFWAMIEDQLHQRVRNHPSIAPLLDELTSALGRGEVAPTAAARRVLARLDEVLGLPVIFA